MTSHRAAGTTECGREKNSHKITESLYQVGSCGYDPAVLLIELRLRQKDLPLENIDRAAVARNGGLSNRVCLAENGISPFAGFGGRRSFASVQAGLLNQHSQRQRPFARGNGFHDEEAFNCN